MLISNENKTINTSVIIPKIAYIISCKLCNYTKLFRCFTRALTFCSYL